MSPFYQTYLKLVILGYASAQKRADEFVAMLAAMRLVCPLTCVDNPTFEADLRQRFTGDNGMKRRRMLTCEDPKRCVAAVLGLQDSAKRDLTSRLYDFIQKVLGTT